MKCLDVWKEIADSTRMQETDLILEQYENTVKAYRLMPRYSQPGAKISDRRKRHILEGYIAGLDFALEKLGVEHESAGMVLGLEAA